MYGCGPKPVNGSALSKYIPFRADLKCSINSNIIHHNCPITRFNLQLYTNIYSKNLAMGGVTLLVFLGLPVT